MTVSGQQLQEWLHAKEDEHLEFKEAKKKLTASAKRRVSDESSGV